MRKEKDALGEVLVPEEAYFGAQTQRAVENFQIGGERFPLEFIQAHALVKKAAARVNAGFGDLDLNLAQAIEQAADEVIEGKLTNQFPLVIWQSGSGTQFNMNMNEVIANRANEILGKPRGGKSPVHPNDHVNQSQSTNDTFPTSIQIAASQAICTRLIPALDGLILSLNTLSKRFETIIKIGRTHLQDATPITLGQEFSGYAAQLVYARSAIQNSLQGLYDLPIGATAVGTGLNTRAGYDEKMVQWFSQWTSLPFQISPNKFAGLASHEPVVTASGSLKTLAAALMKISNDIRWLGSGPRSGLGELRLPANEPGSSIMPGKVNPTQCEMMTMVCCQIIGNDVAVTMAGAMGNFELNVYKPLIAYVLLQSIRLLSDACNSFREKCVEGIQPEEGRIAEHLHRSLMLVTSLNDHIGYDKSAEIALKAWRENSTLNEAAMKLRYVTEEQFDLWVRPERMLFPKNT